MTSIALVDTSSDNAISALFRGRNRELARNLIGIINELTDYWPLTVRQVYYQCVARLLIPNKLAEYQRVSKTLTTLRRNNLVSWDAIEDRTRRTTDKRGVPGLTDFIAEQTESFLDWRYYHRCRVQEQKYYLEVATEKGCALFHLRGCSVAVLHSVKPHARAGIGLHPGTLRALVKEAIESHLDMKSFREQMEIEQQERERLKVMRRDVIGYARRQYPGYFNEGII